MLTGQDRGKSDRRSATSASSFAPHVPPAAAVMSNNCKAKRADRRKWSTVFIDVRSRVEVRFLFAAIRCDSFVYSGNVYCDIVRYRCNAPKKNQYDPTSCFKMFSRITLSTALVSIVSLATAADINPLTVTSAGSQQADALLSAFGPYISSVVNSDAALTSVASALATNPSVLSSFAAVAASISNVPTDAGDFAQFSSLVAELPTPAQSFYSSVMSQEVAIVSSVLNSNGSAPSTALSSSTTSGNTTVTMAAKTRTTAASVSKNAAATGRTMKAAGIAIGFFAGGVALL